EFALALPDRAIIHEFSLAVTGLVDQINTVRLALGDRLPADSVEFATLEPLFHGMGEQGPEPRFLTVSAGLTFHLNRLKMYLPAQGRRMVMQVSAPADQIAVTMAAIVVSAIPTEVPDCLLSV
ncbi:unnamed protein product, partial [marine sediment metagenome]